MICHSKALDLEIIDFEYRHHRIRLGEIIPSQTSRHAMRDGVEHPTSFVEASRKKAQLDRAEQ